MNEPEEEERAWAMPPEESSVPFEGRRLCWRSMGAAKQAPGAQHDIFVRTYINPKL